MRSARRSVRFLEPGPMFRPPARPCWMMLIDASHGRTVLAEDRRRLDFRAVEANAMGATMTDAFLRIWRELPASFGTVRA